MYYEIIQQLAFALDAFHAILDKAEAFASDHEALLNARLAPDMFHLVRQVQIATDMAKFAAARLTDRVAPTFEDNEASFADLHARLKKATDYLQTVTPQQLEGAADRRFVLPYNKESHITAPDYLLQYVIPNFYFHLTTAYGILRSQGVPLGKRDFLGQIRFQPIQNP